MDIGTCFAFVFLFILSVVVERWRQGYAARLEKQFLGEEKEYMEGGEAIPVDWFMWSDL
jgi:hypothetical protein